MTSQGFNSCENQEMPFYEQIKKCPLDLEDVKMNPSISLKAQKYVLYSKIFVHL